MKPLYIVLLCSINVLGVEVASASESPYVSEQQRAIKSLSAADIEALRTGGGAGYAKTAELNGWPGPKHVLELANQLDLSDAQLEASRTLFTEMQAAAITLGERLLLAERELEALFSADSPPSVESVRTISLRIAELDGELRATHLAAHLKQTAILNADQIRRYSELRGYGAATSGSVHQH